MNNRVSAVERLLTIHDNVIKDKVVGQGATHNGGSTSSQTTPYQPGTPPTMSPPNAPSPSYRLPQSSPKGE
jgi:hypothetical protein